MVSPIYYFTRSGCGWCKKMQPSIEQINTTLSDEQKIQIHNTDEEKSKSIYHSIITRHKLKRIVPMLYNSNIGTYLLGYQDKKNVQQFLKANPLKERKPLTPLPKFDLQQSDKKDFENSINISKNSIHLPSSTILSRKEIKYISKKVKIFFTKKH